MSHYYDEQQRSPSEPDDILIDLDIDSFHVSTDNGVFAKDGLDNATKLLIESVTPRDSLLDLGCGYGVVSVAYLRRDPGLDATLVDTNKRALRLSRHNLDRHGLDAKVRHSDAYSDVSDTYTDILTNPPLSAGQDTCKRFIQGAPDHLEDDGRFAMVVPYNNGGEALLEAMKTVFDTVNERSRQGGFRVYEGRR